MDVLPVSDHTADHSTDHWRDRARLAGRLDVLTILYWSAYAAAPSSSDIDDSQRSKETHEMTTRIEI